MTHEMHLGATVRKISRNRGLTLKDEEQDESKPDKEEVAMLVRRMKRFYKTIDLELRKEGTPKENQAAPNQIKDASNVVKVTIKFVNSLNGKMR